MRQIILEIPALPGRPSGVLSKDRLIGLDLLVHALPEIINFQLITNLENPLKATAWKLES